MNMKAINKLAVLIGLSALLPFAASAKTTEEAYLKICAKGPNIPVPVAVVSPTNVSSDYVGTKVEVAFTVDTKGSPTGLSVVSAPDAILARLIVDAVKQWRFTPVSHNGTAVATKVILPIKIVDHGDAFAAN
jgi:TonB family protein